MKPSVSCLITQNGRALYTTRRDQALPYRTQLYRYGASCARRCSTARLASKYGTGTFHTSSMKHKFRSAQMPEAATTIQTKHDHSHTTHHHTNADSAGHKNDADSATAHRTTCRGRANGRRRCTRPTAPTARTAPGQATGRRCRATKIRTRRWTRCTCSREGSHRGCKTTLL